MKKIDESTKVILTFKQLKALVKEGTGSKGNDKWLDKFMKAKSLASKAGELLRELNKDPEAVAARKSQFKNDVYSRLANDILEVADDMDNIAEYFYAADDEDEDIPTTVSEDDEGPVDVDAAIEELFDMYRACKVEPKVCNAIKADGEKTSIFLGRGNSVGGIAKALRDGRLVKVIGFN